MCDTFGKIINKGKEAFFAKNSDRENNEPQVIVYIPKKTNSDKILKTTYIQIEQVKNTHAILISKPSWMWGAEMGVNDSGVCIGNEAIYVQKQKNNLNALLGMDLVRLALERASSAKEAVDIIINLIKKYNQGGNCGYKLDDHYDNSFLIMDKYDIFILETIDKKWALKRQDSASISNCLTINSADRFSDEKDFCNAYSNIYNSFIDDAKKRLSITNNLLKNAVSLKDIFNILRHHNINSEILIKENDNSPCMHGNYQTTSSMVVILKDKPVIWFTGCPMPCISIFKPFIFQDKIYDPILDENSKDNIVYWQNQDKIYKLFTDKKIPDKFYIQRDLIEDNFIKKINSSTNYDYVKIEKEFYKKWIKKII